MMHIEITVTEVNWPDLKVIVRTSDGQVVEDRGQYDIFATKAQPAVTNAFNRVVQTIIKQRKGER